MDSQNNQNAPDVLLLGNGINRAFGEDSWDGLLDRIKSNAYSVSDYNAIKSLPYPLQAVVCTEDSLKTTLDTIAEELLAKSPSEENTELTGEMVSGFDTVVTTNYTYDIEKSINPEFSCSLKKASKFRKTLKKGNATDGQLGLYKCMQVQNGVGSTNIWHMHGEAARPQSMILGHHYYGTLLGRLYPQISEIKREWENHKNNNQNIVYDSWLKYLLLGNVYIVGFGMDLSEFDVWWILSCRKHIIRPQSLVRWYEPNLDTEEKSAKKILAGLYDVEVVTEKVGTEQYKKYYCNLAKLINNKMQQK